jgi:glycosyltransferase involved in cell wall biosynthesis
MFCPKLVISVSKSVKNYLIDEGINSINFVVYNSVRDPSDFTKHVTDRENDGLRVGFVGSLTSPKGIVKAIDLLEAYGSYKGRIIHFDIVGKGPEEATIKKRLLSSTHVTARFHGFCEAPFSIIQDCPIALVPSLFEGFGLVVIEAILAKKIVVCSDLDVFSEISSLDGESRLNFFTHENEDTFFVAMDAAYEQSKDFELLNRNRNYGLRFFSDSQMVNGYRNAMLEMGVYPKKYGNKSNK